MAILYNIIMNSQHLKCYCT